MEGALTILVFMGVIAVTALIFGVWLVITVVRAIFRGLGLLFDGPSSSPGGSLPHGRPMPASGYTRVCANDRCLAANPASARFCRRCGRELPGATHVAPRRAAIW